MLLIKREKINKPDKKGGGGGGFDKLARKPENQSLHSTKEEGRVYKKKRDKPRERRDTQETPSLWEPVLERQEKRLKQTERIYT